MEEFKAKFVTDKNVQEIALKMRQKLKRDIKPHEIEYIAKKMKSLDLTFYKRFSTIDSLKNAIVNILVTDFEVYDKNNTLLGKKVAGNRVNNNIVNSNVVNSKVNVNPTGYDDEYDSDEVRSDSSFR